MDPGLAALIAAVLSGSVTAYGISKDTRSKEQVLKDNLDASIKTQLADAEKRVAEATQLSTATADATKKIADLQKEVDDLKKANQDLQSKASSLSDADAVFKGASAEVLKAAVPIVIRKLASKYTWIQPDGSNVPKTLKALEYPATYAGRLSRMGLYDFFQKRVLKAMAEDQNPRKGGRRRYRKRRGGMDTREEIEAKESALADQAPVFNAESKDALGDFLKEEPVPATAPPSVTTLPSYDDFVLAYTKAIEEATSTIPTARQKRDDALTAQRESYAIGKAIGSEIVQKKAQEKKDKLDAMYAKTLAEKEAKALAPADASIISRGNPLRLPTNILKPAPLAPEDDSVFSQVNPMRLSPEPAPPAPAPDALPVDGADFTGFNPLKKLSEARERMESELSKELPRKLTLRKRKSPFGQAGPGTGGKARKRTLKKRRGGK